MSKLFLEDLRSIFNLNEAEAPSEETVNLDEIGDDVASETDASPSAASPKEEPPADGGDAAEMDALNDLGGKAPEGDNNATDKPVEAPTEAPEAKPVSDEEKIRTMFTDTNDPIVDYDLNNENNVKWAKFKFTNINVDVNTLMKVSEKVTGVTTDILFNRLTQEQKDQYLKSSVDLRNEFPLIEKRERNIIMFNSKVPMIFVDTDGKTKEIDHSNRSMLSASFEKLNEFLLKRFGKDWSDSEEAIEFIQNIKVDFSNESDPISPNLIKSNAIVDDKADTFNKISIKTPETVEKFLKDNVNNDMYKDSSMFKTLVSPYSDKELEGGNSVYVTIKGSVEADTAEQPPEPDAAGAEPEAAGGDTVTDAGAEPDAADAAGEAAPEEKTPELGDIGL